MSLAKVSEHYTPELRVYWIRDKLSGVKILLQCLLLCQLLSLNLLAYSDEKLEDLAEIFKADQELKDYDQKIIQKLWHRYISGKTLSIQEDITVFEYEGWINRKAKKTKSPFDSNYEIYRGLDKEGWKLFVNHRTKNGRLYEVLYLKEKQPTPYFKWSNKKIELLLEVGFRPNRRIVTYEVETGELVQITDTLYDNLGAFYSYDENYILFLSNRDRESLNDTKLSLYAVERNNLEEILRLTFQEDFLGSEYQQYSPVFSKGDRLTMQLKNNLSKTYIFETLINEAKDRARKLKKTKDPVQILKESSNDLEDAFTETKIDEHIIQKSKLILVKSTGQIHLKESYNETYSSEPLMSMPESVYMTFPGPITLPDNKHLLFIKLTNGVPGIWKYNADNRRISQISPPKEYCFGMQYDTDSQTVAYILKRNQAFYLITENLLKPGIVHKFKIPEPSMEPNRSIIKILSSNKFYYLDKKGSWQPADDHQSNEVVEFNQAPTASIDSKPILVFNAPYIPDINTFKEKPKVTRTMSTEKLKNWTAKSITKEIEFIRNSIQWISSTQEHQKLMYRYNQLHRDVTQEINKMDTSDTSMELRLKARWIESLNGLKELLDNSKLLLEVE